jgi:ATP phosphoribosyltransferase
MAGRRVLAGRQIRDAERPPLGAGEITAILPGAGAPTVMPLMGRDDAVAVHAVCQEAVFWETLEKLKAAGASAILVLPIEKMM